MSDRNDELRAMIEEIDSDGEGLTPWEIKFIADLIDREQRTFSDRQGEIIERIYDERL